MRYVIPILFVVLLFLPACSTMGDLSEGISKSKDLISDLKEQYEELKPAIDDAVGTISDLHKQGKDLVEEFKETGEELKALDAEAFEKADKDGSGDLDWLERLSYLILLGGGTLELGRRKLKSMKEAMQSTEARVDHERAKRKELEANIREK